jgi:GT2 family glycosyltransferase
MTSLSNVGVVLLTYGTSNRHVRLADDVVHQGVPARNLVVVHNPDRVPNDADVYVPDDARLVRMASNVGYAAAMNRGIAAARRLEGVEAVVLLTHDVILKEATLRVLHRAAGAYADYAVLGPVLRQPSVRDELSYGSRQRPDGSVGPITDLPGSSEVIDVPCVDGSIMYVRLAALTDDAPLPEGYFMYFEEAYLCSSLARVGWKTGSVPAAQASSTPGGTSRRTAYAYLYARNGLDWTRTFGPRGGGRGFARSQLRRVVADLRRARNLRYCVAQVHGLFDQVRGRSGPPPAWVLRATDISAL